MMFSLKRPIGLLKLVLLCSSILGTYAHIEPRDEDYTVTGFDYAPDYSKDPHPPYPDLKDKNGKNIDVKNVRGVHLFGWTACEQNERSIIEETYDDFYKLAQQQEVYNNIDWNHQAAREFWGAASGKKPIKDDTKKQIQHLDYFMNAPEESPYVDDLQIRYKEQGIADWHFAYGPYNAKLTRNWIGDGFYTQRNADTYAWFALAKYVQGQIGRKRPTETPKDHSREPIKASSDEDKSDSEDLGTEEIDAEHTPGFTTPGCGDRNPSTPKPKTADAPSKDDAPPPQTKCDKKNALSGVPYNVFSGQAGKVYTHFCVAANGNKRILHWTFDSKGNLKKSPRTSKRNAPVMRIDKRTPPPDPAKYDSFDFELSWEPAEVFDRTKCTHTCVKAYDALASSPCGHQGGEQNVMTAEGRADVGCGVFRYTITGPDVPKPGPEDPPPSSSPSPSSPPPSSPPPAPPAKPTCSVSGNGGGGDPFDTGGPHTCTCELDGKKCSYESTETSDKGQTCDKGCVPE
ncbi:MAG: hypothetical protein Q9160_006763 [Pyrenula sp. 1 TL-2023]